MRETIDHQGNLVQVSDFEGTLHLQALALPFSMVVSSATVTSPEIVQV